MLKSIPQILNGYIGPNKIDAETAESCMLAVNSVNECAFCTSLHGELGRMAGLGDTVWKKINEAKSGADIKKISGNDPMVVFFFTLVTSPRRSLSLKLSDTRVYEPQIRARLGNTAHLCKATWRVGVTGARHQKALGQRPDGGPPWRQPRGKS